MLYYGGESNVPGAPGNLFAGTPSFDINRRPGSLGGRSGEQLKRLYEGGTQQNEKLNEELRNRGIMPGAGPQLPLASNQPFGFPMGNAAGVANAQFFEGAQLAQAYPGGQPVGNVAGLGGAMQMNPGLMDLTRTPRMQGGPAGYSAMMNMGGRF
jgi:hypothetical protein